MGFYELNTAQADACVKCFYVLGTAQADARYEVLWIKHSTSGTLYYGD